MSTVTSTRKTAAMSLTLIAAMATPIQAQAVNLCSQLRNTLSCGEPVTVLQQLLSLISFG